MRWFSRTIRQRAIQALEHYIRMRTESIREARISWTSNIFEGWKAQKRGDGEPGAEKPLSANIAISFHKVHKLLLAVNPGLRIDALDVSPCRVLRDVQRLCDMLRRPPADEKPEYLALPLGQIGPGRNVLQTLSGKSRLLALDGPPAVPSDFEGSLALRARSTSPITNG